MNDKIMGFIWMMIERKASRIYNWFVKRYGEKSEWPTLAFKRIRKSIQREIWGREFDVLTHKREAV